MSYEAVNLDIEVDPRRADHRGHISQEWLESYHTFSYGTYKNSEFDSFAVLHRLTEERARETPQEYDASNYHSEFDMLCYMLSGALTHKDALGHYQELKRGDVQMLSTGSGISHSEYNRSSGDKTAHYINLWLKPNIPTSKAIYQVRHFSEADKKDKLCCILRAKSLDDNVATSTDHAFTKAEPNTQLAKSLATSCSLQPSAILSTTESSIHASVLFPGQTLSYQFGSGTSSQGEKRYVYIFVPSSHHDTSEISHLQHVRYTDSNRSRQCLKVNGNVVLNEGDGAFIRNAYSASAAKDTAHDDLKNESSDDENSVDDDSSSLENSTLVLESIGSEPVELLIVDCEKSRHEHHHHHHSKALR